jgi:hypothetical protein
MTLSQNAVQLGLHDETANLTMTVPGELLIARADRRRRRRRLACTGAGLVTATVTAVGLPIGVSSTSAPAFAVETQSDGDVVVTINDLSDADGLQNALRDAGVNATVLDRSTPYTIPESPGVEQPPGQLPASGDQVEAHPLGTERPPGYQAMWLTTDGEKYVLDISAESELADSPIEIYTNGDDMTVLSTTTEEYRAWVKAHPQQFRDFLDSCDKTAIEDCEGWPFA